MATQRVDTGLLIITELFYAGMVKLLAAFCCNACVFTPCFNKIANGSHS